MPHWNVEGADAGTGHDRVVTVEAQTQKDAEQAARKMGMVVSAVHRAVTRTPAEALDEMVGSVINTPFQPQADVDTAVSEAPQVVQYRSPGAVAGPAPTYTGLKLGASILSVFAILYYVLAVLAVVLSLIPASNPQGVPTNVMWWSVAGGIVAGVTLGMIGAFLHTASAACLALRDIARNSFR